MPPSEKYWLLPTSYLVGGTLWLMVGKGFAPSQGRLELSTPDSQSRVPSCKPFVPKEATFPGLNARIGGEKGGKWCVQRWCVAGWKNIYMQGRWHEEEKRVDCTKSTSFSPSVILSESKKKGYPMFLSKTGRAVLGKPGNGLKTQCLAGGGGCRHSPNAFLKRRSLWRSW